MSTKDKLIERFKKQPKDFTFDELVKLFSIFGFTIDNKGKTSGSRVVFEKDDKALDLHKPHPSNIIKKYVMEKVMNFLSNNNFIKKEEE
ncbi:MAG: type II toxin-antitoxin system HicA family toxin [Dysgonamonadaceae bacterium]|nr:type II toxin-antitoxin system HicA family toxin [Dysgonamonadaceae bacterium]